MGRGKSELTHQRVAAAYAYAEENQPVTVRGCAYHLFTRNLIGTMSANGKGLTGPAEVSRILTRAREEGDFPWEWIVDEGRGVEGSGAWDDPAEMVEYMLDDYRKNYWTMQPKHVELWSEKSTVRGLLGELIRHYQLPFSVQKGFTSATEAKETTYRVKRAARQGKPFVALYVAHRDPSGLWMSERDLPAGVDYGCLPEHFTIQRVALIKDDLKGLPSFDLETKKDDPRFRWYQENYHREKCWELDAMNPRALRKCVEEAVLSHINLAAWRQAASTEEGERETMLAFHNSFKSLRRQDDDDDDDDYDYERDE